MTTIEHRRIAVEDLIDNPDNPRSDLGPDQDLVELANSLAKDGNTDDCHVVPVTDGEDAGKWMLLEGHRRKAAALLGNVTELDCKIRHDLDTKAKQIAFMITANTHRENFTEMDTARGVQSLLDCEGMNVKAVAKSLSRGEKYVRSRSKMTKLSTAAQGKIEDSTLNIEQAMELLTFADDKEAEERLLKVADKPNDWEVRLAAEKELRAWRENLPRLTAELQGAGVEVADRPEGPQWEWKDFSPTYADHEITEAVERDLVAIVHPDFPKITWARKREAQKPWTPPEKTPEEIAAAVRRGEIIRGLELAAPVREAFLRGALKKPEASVVHQLALDMAEQLPLAAVGFWLGIEEHEEIDDQEIVDGIAKLSTDQLIVLNHLVRHGGNKEELLADLAAWGRDTGYMSTGPWRESLEHSYSYKWTEAELDAIQYFAAQKAATAEGDDDDEA
ncbi:ParB/RepB/Spo0J family partition protein [Paenarthrobacter sp. YJN-5]|uniref:ParB/RepB/Spo0J family partition protein n=1 Tax=Paenarthrobacter sp. YJN-5 TaxID=2735316 RepID=UPI001878638C|nr:ParB/RepB/Spo0J family partition protein [Paenarthrobacter sp. YJN-5]QOT16504.1 ParB/RepB/Spo0J family partition protein [Paenarthrobacter sp. YJN-5]